MVHVWKFSKLFFRQSSKVVALASPSKLNWLARPCKLLMANAGEAERTRLGTKHPQFLPNKNHFYLKETGDSLTNNLVSESTKCIELDSTRFYKPEKHISQDNHNHLLP